MELGSSDFAQWAHGHNSHVICQFCCHKGAARQEADVGVIRNVTYGSYRWSFKAIFTQRRLSACQSKIKHATIGACALKANQIPNHSGFWKEAACHGFGVYRS